jgi:TRAP-type C4-dicarboxylate transport system permease small subunit
MARILYFLNKILARLSQAGLAVAAAGLVLMMFLIGFDVIMRYLLNRPIAGSMELTEFLMSLTIGFGLAYCAFKKGHIRVDLVLMHVPTKVQRILDIIAYFVSFGFCCLIVWQTFENGQSIMQTKITSSVLLIPVFPFIFLLAIAMAILALVFLKDILEHIAEVKNNWIH